MLPAGVVALYLPALVWVVVGLALLAAYRWSTPRWVLRLAAAFLGLWALFATTVLIWVLSNGGYAAILTLAHDPLTIFAPRWAPLWALGGVGAFAVFSVAFAVNQLVGRGFLYLLHPTPMPWPRARPASSSASPARPTSATASRSCRSATPTRRPRSRSTWTGTRSRSARFAA